MSTANATIHFISLFLANRMMRTITKQCHSQAAVANVARAMNVECYFNILTECSKITFQILKTARRDTE